MDSCVYGRLWRNLNIGNKHIYPVGELVNSNEVSVMEMEQKPIDNM